MKYTNPLYRPKICDASACVDSGPTTDSIAARNPSNPAMCSMCPGNSSWFTMYNTSSAVIP